MKIMFHPLFLLSVTAIAFQFGVSIYNKTNRFAVLQPVVVTALIVFSLLYFLDIPVATYREETKILPTFLGPVIVALAVPLYESMCKVREAIFPVLCTLVFGGSAVVFGGYALGCFAKLDTQMSLSLLTRSSTAPIALEISEKIGGNASFTILGVLISGILGSASTPFILDACRIENQSVRGFTLGFTSHAFGVARAVEMGSEATAFATIGMGLMACTAAIILPLVFGAG